MASVKYAVLIRTFNSARTLAYTLECLANQSHPPDQYIFVDSGSTDSTTSFYPRNSIYHRYVGREFNYSEAINQGLEHVDADYVFIVSSHTLLLRKEAIEYALNTLHSNERLGAAYFSSAPPAGWRIQHTVIDKSKFDGQNGLCNWCALIRMDLLKLRNFRPEVFAAEDQEWARWLFEETGLGVAQIANCGAINHNYRGDSLRKARNDYVGVAYFSNRSLMSWSKILGIFGSVFSPLGGARPKHRWSQLILAGRLVRCKFSPPVAKSRYF